MCNPGDPQEFVGGRDREKLQPMPTPPSIAHTHTHTHTDFPGLKKSLKSIFKIIRGNSKYEMHFRGFPSWETIPKEDGERGGDKKWNSAPRE